MEQTIEQKVADAILERDVSSINIDGVTYRVAPPTIATLILVSEIISTLPVVDKNIPKEQIVYSVLHHAKFYHRLGEIAAILILGAKGLTEETITYTEKRSLFGLIRRKIAHREIIDHKAILAKKIIENVSPSVLFRCIIDKLDRMEVGHFFLITTSLSEANLIKPTKEVGN